MNIEHEDMEAFGFGIVLAHGEDWCIAIQIGRHAWSLSW